MQTQKNNFAPRVGFAYQVTPKFVVRGGFGLFYNSFENQGYGPNIGENYPFVLQLQLSRPSGPTGSPVSRWSHLYSLWHSVRQVPGGTATFESGLSCVAFTPLAVNASGPGAAGTSVQLSTLPVP